MSRSFYKSVKRNKKIKLLTERLNNIVIEKKRNESMLEVLKKESILF